MRSVSSLLDPVPEPEDAVGPGGRARLLAAVPRVRPRVVLVRRLECYVAFFVTWEAREEKKCKSLGDGRSKNRTAKVDTHLGIARKSYCFNNKYLRNNTAYNSFVVIFWFRKKCQLNKLFSYLYIL